MHRKAERDAWTETNSPRADRGLGEHQTMDPVARTGIIQANPPIILFGQTAGERAKETNAA